MNFLSRRDFLEKAGLTTGILVGTPFIRAARASDPPPKAKRVLVLGAGMSGLTAALALHRRGHHVEVIEYQKRVGGRLLSVALKDGQFTEAGGGHFRTNMPLVCGYLEKYKLPLISMNDGTPRYHVDDKVADGSLMKPWPWAMHANERNVELSSLLASYLVRAGINLNTVLDSAWPDPATLAKYDKVALKGLLQSLGASEAFIKLVDAHSAEATVDTAVLALLPDFAYHFADRNLFRIAGGNDRLPKVMAEVLGKRVNLDSPVVSIKQTATQASVKTKDGREWIGDAIISTIPFPVLRELQVEPKLSPRKQELIEKLGWSPVVKVYVQTKTAPWLQQGVRGWPMAASDRPWERVVDITGNEPGGHGNVFFYMTGKNAEHYRSRPKETRAHEVLAQFREDLPGLLDDVIEMGEFSWPDQPWIKAAFADLPLGGGWMIKEWQTPEGRLHFAGDFTTLKSGWVEGAIESGLRAARQIDPGARAEFEL